MKLYQLFEANNDVLYHLTNVNALSNIINTDKFQLALNATNDSELKMGNSKYFYMSLARNVSSGYISDKGQGNSIGVGVILKINGRKLSQRYSLKPVEYWGLENGRQGGDIPTSRGREQEERLFSNDQYIDNALSYIDEIRILIPYNIDQIHNNDEYAIKKNSFYRKLYITLSKINVPVKWYMQGDFSKSYAKPFATDDEKNIASNIKRDNQLLIQSFITGSDKNQINPAQLFNQIDKMKPSKYDRNAFKAGDKGKIKRGMKNPHDYSLSYIEFTKELTFKNKFNELSPKARSMYYYMTRSPEEAVRQLQADIHNSRGTMSSKDMDSVLKMMKALNVRTPNEIVNKLKNKWDSIPTESINEIITNPDHIDNNDKELNYQFKLYFNKDLTKEKFKNFSLYKRIIGRFIIFMIIDGETPVALYWFKMGTELHDDDNTFTNIRVAEKYKRTGLTTDFYLYILNKYKKLSSDVSHTEGSKMLYRALIFKHGVPGYSLIDGIEKPIKTMQDFDEVYNNEESTILLKMG